MPSTDPALRRPFPLLWGDAAAAGRALGALGFRLQEIRLAAGARVVVFGPGDGNLAIALARLGFGVVAIDPDPAVRAFVAGQGTRRGVRIEAVEAHAGPFDAAVIETGDLGPLLGGLHRLVPDGSVYLARDAEAADPSRDALLQAGWLGRRRCSADLPWAPVWELSRWPRPVQAFPAGDGRLGSFVGITSPEAEGAVIRLAGGAAGCGVFGPHVPLAPGRYRGLYRFAGPVSAGLTIDACMDRGVTVLAQAPVPAGAAEAGIEFLVPGFADEIEVRLFAEAGVTANVTGLTLAMLG